MEIAVGDADGVAQVLLLDEAEVVDAGRLGRRQRRWRNLALDVTAEHEGDGGSMAAALESDVDPTQVVGIEVELDALAAECGIDLELEAGQGDLGSAANGAN